MSTSERRSTLPWGTYLRDTCLFAFGVALVMKQAGMWFAPPEGGPSIPLIIVGALFCNGPLVIQALAIRFGTSGSPGPSVPPASPSQPEPSSAPSSGGE